MAPSSRHRCRDHEKGGTVIGRPCSGYTIILTGSVYHSARPVLLGEAVRLVVVVTLGRPESLPIPRADSRRLRRGNVL